MEKTTEVIIAVPRSFYNQLIDDSRFLECLKEVGVDNWEGYGEALNLMSRYED